MTRTPRRTRHSVLGRFAILLLASVFGAGLANAAALNRISLNTVANYKSVPTTSVESAPPLVMLAMSNDEQLYVKAYTDYTDLNGDGNIDTTYENSFNYTGYFDSSICYEYTTSGTGGARFRAAAAATASSTDLAAVPPIPARRCTATDTHWSGNFLNWLTMTRIDVVRSVLYGGLRQVDTAAQTILERAFVPTDIHSWAKVYNNVDIVDFTPYASGRPVSFCNVSLDGGTQSATAPAAPLLRVAVGAFSEWATTEIRQCHWRAEYQSIHGGDGRRENAPAGTISPDQLTVRVEVCRNTAGIPNEAFCRPYVNGAVTTFKPAGLLQRYGEGGELRFGLISGSYSKPRSGGQLRKNIRRFANVNGDTNLGCETGDEVNLTNGTFCTISLGSGSEGIVNALNRLRIWQWNTADSRHSDCNTFGIQNRQGFSSPYLNNPGAGSDSRECNSWGNPLSELYAEALRYFSTPSAQATTGFIGTEPNILPFGGGDPVSVSGRPPVVNWSDPLTAQTYCADCSIVVISTGLNSFDTDEIPVVPALGMSADAATDFVGANEGLSGQYVVGRTTATAVGVSLNTHEDVCSAKDLPGLSAARGICPEIPSFEGGYHIAGLAHRAFTTDLRSDLQDTQVVQTYAIALAESLPGFTIPVGSGQITISPACQANNSGSAQLADPGWRSCALANVSVGLRASSIAPNYVYGRPLEPSGRAGSFFVGWEDSPWGNDRDLDMTTMVTYCVGSRCRDRDIDANGLADICFRSDSTAICSATGDLITTVGADEVLVRVEALSADAGNALMGGFSISGAAENNGLQRPFLRPGGGANTANLLSTVADPPTTWSRPKVMKFRAGSTTAGQLPNPLLYAAKYGGFNEIIEDGKPTPSEPREWDEINNVTGLNGADGLPDNYFPVRNPAQLQDRLADVFNDILRRASSGTAAAVVANAREGEGAVYQALFEPGRIAGNKEANWIGTLHGLWLDSAGRLREDGDRDATLDEFDFGTDPVIQIYFDTDTRSTKFRRFTGDPINNVSVDDLPLDQLRTLWNARERLSALTDASLANQRSYDASAAGGRYIFTFLDYDRDGIPDANEVADFVPNTFVANSTTGNLGILNVQNKIDADRVVNFIRGQEPAPNLGLRSRRINYDGSADGSEETLRLGDIVQSTPTVVGTPAEAFDLLYNDQTYALFREQYRNRRNVVYVGANDGLLHAFNGGFFSAQTKSFNLTPPSPVPFGGPSFTPHPLGSELWAYAPFNLLPHLTWLTDSDYPHVWYVDGKPRAFDARIFAADDEHPGGWGTVLVVGMRLGGAPLQLSRPDGTGVAPRTSMSDTTYRDVLSRFGATRTNNFTLTTRSAYIVLDVTNPEEPPKLIAEISDPQPSTTTGPKLGFTTSFPTVATVSNVGNTLSSPPTTDGWYLVFGSGPRDTALDGSPPTSAAGIYLWNLKTRSFEASWGPRAVTSASASFVGDPVSVDWDLDFKADALYFGTVGGSIAAPTGSLYKIDVQDAGDLSRATNEARPVGSWDQPRILVNAGAPVVSTPAVTFDEFGKRWVFAGTGRFFANEDKPTSAPQYLFGVLDRPDHPSDPPVMPPMAARPVTQTNPANYVNVTNASVRSNAQVSGVTGVTTETQLIRAVETAGGWRLNLNDPTDSSERNVNTMSLLGDILFATGFTPSDDLCLGEGSSRLFGLNFKTGAAKADLPVFGSREITVGAEVLKEAIRDVDLGAGLSASPSLSLGSEDKERGVTVFTQTSTGAIEREEGELDEGTRSGESDWRERFE